MIDSYTWTFNLLPGRQFELVLKHIYDYPMSEIVYSTGYISEKLMDILKAAYYLNYGKLSDLSTGKLSILNYYHSVIQKFLQDKNSAEKM